MRLRTIATVAAAGMGLAALFGGCKSEPTPVPSQGEQPQEQPQQQEQEENHIGEMTVRISPSCIYASESVSKNGGLMDSVRWCQNRGARLRYWVNNNDDTVVIYAVGTLTNPEITGVCVPFDGCFTIGGENFAKYEQGAKAAWGKQCEGFGCKGLEERWEKGEFNYEPFEL